MADSTGPRLDRPSFRLLLGFVSLGALAVLVLPPWYPLDSASSKYVNGLVAFAVLGIAADSSFLPLSRISLASVSSSVAFIPLIGATLLFDHPWPMLLAGLTALVVCSLVERKPFYKVWFNAVQYMLAVGLAGFAYKALGGPLTLEGFSFSLTPFLALLATFFAVNQGSVALAVASTTGISVREAWAKIAGGSLLYDFVSSSLAILLAFLYVELNLLGLAVLILPLFFVRHMYHMNLQVERVNRELLELMVKSIEARDPYTSGHSLRVSEYARSIARESGLSPKQVEQIATAALLHDVGKIYEEFAPLLRKEGRLSPEERMLMQAHPVRSAELVGTIAEFRGAVESAIRNHHENFDGTGYPDGLVAKNIPIGARVIMIADTLDAMTTDRPYRKALSLNRAIEELNKYSGQQFDPALVDLVSSSPSIRRLLGVHTGPGGELPVTPSPQLVRERSRVWRAPSAR